MKKITKILLRLIYIPIFFICVRLSIAEIAVIGAFSFLFAVFEWTLTGDTVVALEIFIFSLSVDDKVYEFLHRIT